MPGCGLLRSVRAQAGENDLQECRLVHQGESRTQMEQRGHLQVRKA